MFTRVRACQKIAERGCVVLDQPQQTPVFLGVEEFAACCGWSSTQPRSFFRQALRIVRRSLCAFYVLLTCCVGRQVSVAADSLWSLRSWQAEDGLPDNNVTGVAQTSEGYLWVSTHAGLARFDGVRFVSWPLPVGTGISNSLVRTLMLGRDNQLWAALEAGAGLVVGFSGPATNVFTSASGVPNFKPLVMAQTPDGAVWVSYVDGSVCRMAKAKVERFGSREGLTGVGGSWLATDADGQLWFAKAGRVGVFTNGQFEAKWNSPNRIVRIARARDGGVWIVAGLQLLKCVHGREPVALARISTQRPGVEPAVIHEDRLGGVWIGTTAGGLFRWDGKEIAPVETSHSDITSVTEDSEGNIWAGTEGGGLDRLRHRVLELHGSADGLPFETARSVCVDDAGVVWATGANGALVRYNADRWQTITNGLGWQGARATCVANDRRGGVWVGTYHGGILHWQDGRFNALRREDGLAGETVRALLVDSRGDLWIGLETANCLQRLHDGVLKTFAQPAGSRTIRAIVEDAAGKIWLGTSDGFLLRVEGDELVDETPRALQPTKPIRALHATPDGSVWIAYAAAGVGWLRGGKFSRFGMEHGLPNNYICGIASDDGGALWFTSGHGIFQVRQREFETVAEGRSSRVLAVDFGRNEGLLNLQGSYGYSPAAAQGTNGQMWYATRSGLVAARPDRVQANRIPPMVLMEQLMVDGRPMALPANGGRVRLPPDHRKVEVEFTALNFAAPESILLQHRLTGWDEDWSEPKSERSVAFSRLQAGQYELHVMARNAAGVWNREGAKLMFEVEPFLWQRWWFRIAAVGAFTVVIIAIVRYVSFRRLRQKLLRLEQETALQRDRVRIAHDLHDDLGANLTQIALLSELAQKDFEKPAAARGHLDQIFRTAKSLTRSLDEIVWAVNPKNDSLDRFVAHLCTFVPEYLHSAGVRCRLDVPEEVPELVLPANVRHHLHLAVKEALHNVVKHARASEVRLQLRVGEDELVVAIEDDGQGSAESPAKNASQDGLLNLPDRMREVGGRFERRTGVGQGTTIRLTVPLRQRRRSGTAT